MIPSPEAQRFAEICRHNGYNVEESSLRKMDSYVSSLLSWNTKINLISRASAENIWSEHILHSVAPVLMRVFPEKSPVLDLGTGGGLPGVPLAVLFPHARVTLLDSIKKKTKALRHVIEEIALDNVDVVTGRAEELREVRGRFQVIATRGVAALDQLVEWARILLAERGERTLIAYKGGDLTEEIANASKGKRPLEIRQCDIQIAGEERMNVGEKKLVIVRL